MSDPGISLLLPRKAAVFLRYILNSKSTVGLQHEDPAVLELLKKSVGVASLADNAAVELPDIDHVRCLGRVLDLYSKQSRKEATVWSKRATSAEQIKASLFRHVFWRDRDEMRERLTWPVKRFLRWGIKGHAGQAKSNVLSALLTESGVTKTWQLLKMTEEELQQLIGDRYLDDIQEAVARAGTHLGLQLRREEMVGLRFGVAGAKVVKDADAWAEKEMGED